MRLAGPPLTPSADPAREIPRAPLEREWTIDAALDSLHREEPRLKRLGLELPLARCREQRRFWEFLRAIHGVADAASEPTLRRSGWLTTEE